MLTVAFTFPGGYIHATPWGRHVNEGEVEWPPSPWRIARALLATGLGRCGWRDVSVPARELIQALGSHPPTWFLPRGGLGHTRHYMPGSAPGRTDKVLDAFVFIGRANAAFARWDWRLGAEHLAVLDDLLERLGYLGRAESWVRARRVDDLPDEADVIRCDVGRPPGVAADPVEGLALMPPEAYDSWRERNVAAHLARRLAELQADDRRKGKAPRRVLSKGDQAKIVSQYPVDPVDTLLFRSSELRKAGWSEPPGTWRCVTWRPRAVLQPTPPAQVHDGVSARPTFALFRITPATKASPTLAPMRDTMRRAEAIHQTLVGLAPTPVFTAAGTSRHEHTHILTLSLDQQLPRSRLHQARFDHLLLWARMGFDTEARAVLLGGFRFYAKNLPPQRATLVGLTDNADQFEGRVPAVDRSRVWVSETPWVPPRHVKRRGRSSLEGQIRESLATRGFPDPDRVEIETDEGWQSAAAWVPPRGDVPVASWWRHFRIEREKSGAPPPPQRLAIGLRLSFAGEVSGPICLGYGAHFGLGRFGPAEGFGSSR